MKKFFKILSFVIILIVSSIGFCVLSLYKSDLTKADGLVLATSDYIHEYDVYPNFLSSYLFEKYERNSLYQAQKESPNPYLFFINASYDFSDSESDLKMDRFNDVEDDLVCIGLSSDRVDIYLERINIFKGPSDYLLNKYKRFDYETLSAYCNMKMTTY